MTVVRPSDATHEPAPRSTAPGFLSHQPDSNLALASVAARVGVHMIHKVLQPTPTALAIGRSIVASACAAWNVSAVADAAQVIVTELLANAVRHAGTPMELQVSLHRRYLRLSVHDRSAAPARLTGPDHEGATGGRGLLVVGALAAAWGSTPTVNGKVVWANLRCHTGQRCEDITANGPSQARLEWP
jgi:anti-sigma regulatory factor (Ser/Thr protein kinase)